jgi:hypothetical protein
MACGATPACLARYALDHLNVCDLELKGLGVKQGGQECVHGVAMQHSARAPQLKGLWRGREEGR